jgi:hypothetical protein
LDKLKLKSYMSLQGMMSMEEEALEVAREACTRTMRLLETSSGRRTRWRALRHNHSLPASGSCRARAVCFAAFCVHGRQRGQCTKPGMPAIT